MKLKEFEATCIYCGKKQTITHFSLFFCCTQAVNAERFRVSRYYGELCKTKEEVISGAAIESVHGYECCKCEEFYENNNRANKCCAAYLALPDAPDKLPLPDSIKREKELIEMEKANG